MTKNTFYFMLKALFVLKTFKFLLWFIGHVEKLHGFWRKAFLKLYSITWRSFIARLLLVLEILDKMCIVIICFPVCEVMHFEINLSILIKPFFTSPKRQNKKRNTFRIKRTFNIKQKAFFIILKGFLAARDCLRHKSRPF